jgi:hypothetical protein
MGSLAEAEHSELLLPARNLRGKPPLKGKIINRGIHTLSFNERNERTLLSLP